MKASAYLVAATLFLCASAHAQVIKANPKAKIGASKSDGQGRSIASEQQQVEADKYKMRQDKLMKKDRQYKKDARRTQRDQERLNRDSPGGTR